MPVKRKQIPLGNRQLDGPLLGLFESVSDPVILIDAEGTILDVNPPFMELYSGHSRHPVGSSAFISGNPEDGVPEIAPGLQQKVDEALHTGKAVSFERKSNKARRRYTVVPVLSSTPSRPCLLVIISPEDVPDGLIDITCPLSIAEQKPAEDGLITNKQRLTHALEAAGAGIWEWNLESGKNIWSDELWALCGLTKGEKEPSFNLWENTIHPEDRERVARSIGETARQQLDVNIEFRVLHPDGSVRWLYSRGKPLRDDSGKAICYIGTIIDISDRKQAEEKLTEIQKRLDFALENSHIGCWELDMHSFSLSRTAELDRIFGHETPLPEWTYQILLEHILPEDRASVDRQFRSATSSLQNQGYEYRIRRPDGTIRWIWSTAGFQHDNTGRPHRLTGIVQDITEKQQMLESLQKSEAEYRSLFDNMPKGICYCQVIYDEDALPIDFIHLNVNASFEKLTGLKEIIGKRITEIFPGIREDDDDFFMRHCRVAETGVTEHFEYFFSSLRQWVAVSVSSAEKGYFVAVVDIITEQKEAARMIEQGKAKLDAALSSMSDAIFFSDSEGNFIDFNEAFATFHKFSSKAECAKQLSDYHRFLDVFMMDGTLAPLENWAVPRALRGEIATNAEYILQRKDTGDIWVGSYGFAPIRDNEGSIVGSIVTAHDITEKKRAEMTLRESELKFRNIFDHSPVAISIEEILTGRIIDVNTSWQRLFGYPKNEVLGRAPADIGLLYENMQHEKIVEALNAEGHLINMAIQMRRKSGEIIDSLCSAEFMTLDGSPCILLMATDVTESNKAAVESEKLQGQLQQAQKMELVGQLAGGIAHDFNNVLAAILGHAELLIDQITESHPFHENLETIRKSAVRSAQMIHQLLAFARKQVMVPQSLELNDSIESIYPMLRSLIRENIRLDWHPDGKRSRISIDPSQIDQIVTNLLVNARDAIIGNGVITIETGSLSVDATDCVSGHICHTPGSYARLSVHDTGCGIDQQVLPHIFEPYFTTKEVGKGSGLGLSTVYGIVKQNNGYIDCHTSPQQGTTFDIFLPTLFEAGSTETADESVATIEETRKTVLIVEDEPEILKLTKHVLEKSGYKVMATSSSEAALDIARKCHGNIDLLVTDIMMPSMNGIELCERLVGNDPKLKVLFMTGYAEEMIDFHDMLKTGINYIQKPFTFSDFNRAVKRLLDNPPG